MRSTSNKATAGNQWYDSVNREIAVYIPGLITLMGSGETAPGGRVFYESSFQTLPPPVNVAIMETPAGFELNSSDVAGRVAGFIEHRLQNYKPNVTVVPARRNDTEFGTNNFDILRPLLNANYIFMGPGSPSYTVRHLTGSLAWEIIRARHRLGACLAFSSSAAIAIGLKVLPVYEIYKVGEDPHWIQGLDLLGELGISAAFVTHWNNTEGGTKLDTSRCYIGKPRLEALLATLPSGTALVGIDEHTSLTFDFSKLICRVIGKGTVTIINDGDERVFEQNSEIPLGELGSLNLPMQEEGILSNIWNSVVAASEIPVDTPLPQNVAELIAERQVARQRKDWDTADLLRDLLQDMGYAVSDAVDGSSVRATDVD